MRFVFVTVTDCSPQSRRRLETLISSIERQAIEGELVLVLRGGAEMPSRIVHGLTMHRVAAPLVIGLSDARNRALAYVREHGLMEYAGVVAFPDDDCAYPDGLLARVAAVIAAGTPVVCGSFAPSPDEIDRARFPAEDQRLSSQLVMRTSASSSVFLSPGAVRAVGNFDERLGLGGRYGASEDADYVLRALSLGFSGVYRPADIFVIHPYKAHRPDEYYVGNVAVLAKHALRRGGTSRLLARRLAFGAFMVVRRRIPARRYARAVGATVALLSAPR